MSEETNTESTDAVPAVAEPQQATAAQIIHAMARRVPTPKLVQPDPDREEDDGKPRQSHRPIRLPKDLVLEAIQTALEPLAKKKGEAARVVAKALRFLTDLQRGVAASRKDEVVLERTAVNALLEIAKPVPLPEDFELPDRGTGFGAIKLD